MTDTIDTTERASTRRPSRMLESIAEERIRKLEQKVEFLWKMVLFLETYPNYKVGDYLLERNTEVMALTKDGVRL